METWKDIVADMRSMREFYGAEYRAMADRIEKACKTLEDVLIVEQDENAKLRRALEPVMKCAVCKEDGMPVADGEICTSSDYGVCDYEGNALDWHDVAECLDAVREAQAIMKGGAK